MAEEATAAVEEERELASQPIPGLVRKYTIITGQGMLAQIIMVVLEGLVMGWGLGAHGLACVSIIMSVEYINLAFGNLFGTGVPAVVGNLLGAGDIKGASKAFSQGFWLTTIVSVLLAVVMAVFTEPSAHSSAPRPTSWPIPLPACAPSPCCCRSRSLVKWSPPSCVWTRRFRSRPTS